MRIETEKSFTRSLVTSLIKTHFPQRLPEGAPSENNSCEARFSEENVINIQTA